MKKEEKQRELKRRLSDDTGEPSLGRWMVYYGTILSGVLVMIGIIITIFEVGFQPYILPPGLDATIFHSNMGIPMIATGVGIYTSGAIAKSWQSHAEAQKMATPTNSVGEESYAGKTDDSNPGA